MRFAECSNCSSKIPFIDFRKASYNEASLVCPSACGHKWALETVNEIIDKVDAARLRKKLKGELAKGTKCYCCGQFAKMYKRKLNSGIARALIELNRLTKSGDWLHISNLVERLKVSPEMSKASWWGLVESKANIDDSKKDSGLWRLTDNGKKFVLKQISVSKYACIYNNKLLSLTGDDISIEDALGDKFNYSELMSLTI